MKYLSYPAEKITQLQYHHRHITAENFFPRSLYFPGFLGGYFWILKGNFPGCQTLPCMQEEEKTLAVFPEHDLQCLKCCLWNTYPRHGRLYLITGDLDCLMAGKPVSFIESSPKVIIFSG